MTKDTTSTDLAAARALVAAADAADAEQRTQQRTAARALAETPAFVEVRGAVHDLLAATTDAIVAVHLQAVIAGMNGLAGLAA